MHWKVTGTSLDILGSIHKLPATPALSEACRLALDRSRVIAFERDPSSDRANQTIYYDPGDRLSIHLPPALMEKVKAAWDGADLDVQFLDTMRPRFVAAILSDSLSSALGFQRAFGVESHVQAGWAAGRRVEYLEATDVAFDAQTDISDEEAVAALTEVLSDGKQDQGFGAMAAAWHSADLEALEKFINSCSTPDLLRQLNAQRNAHWLPKLIAFAREPDAVVAIVGSAHMLGTGSIPELLAANGLPCEYIGWGAPSEHSPSAVSTSTS